MLILYDYICDLKIRMSTINHQLAEVLCGFWFKPESNSWDSTCFGKFYDKILKLGFSEKQEQKAVQIKMEFKTVEGAPATAPEMTEGDNRMIFRNPANNSAIILSANYLSFHKLPPYNGWDQLISDIVNPGLAMYREIGLGNDLVQVQSLYLNRYNLKPEDKLSEIFSFLPATESFGVGFEHNLVFQSQYELSPNITVNLKLNCNTNSLLNEKVAFLECTSFAKAMEKVDETKLIKDAHDKTNLVFNNIIKK